MANLKSLFVPPLFLLLSSLQAFAIDVGEFGVEIGDFRGPTVAGKVYAVDENTLYVKGFKFNVRDADAFFWAGKENVPSASGEIVQYPAESKTPDLQKLPVLNDDSFILKLPHGLTITSLKSLAVWDKQKSESLGSVVIPESLVVPEPRVLPEFSRLAHDLRSGNVTILDAKTFLIPDLHYDGKGPDAYFLVGNGSEPNGNGVKVPNEHGDLNVLRKYNGETIVIQLPKPLTVYNIEWLVMWCIKYKHNFGYVRIPKDLNVPPALGQNKIGVQERKGNGAAIQQSTIPKKVEVQVQERKGNGAAIQQSTFATVIVCLVAVLFSMP
ncbi:protein Skeletor, isoforms B/C-like [Cloeon dipterum]|uniref:protein Skeletor, isoforms B/C-like n=1 Tax=Cloeon dipterum TaxID=197152 RepID=UPI00321FCE50